MTFPPMENLQTATLAVELKPIWDVIGPTVDRVRMTDQVLPFDYNRSGVVEPLDRVWEGFCDYLITALKVLDGADPVDEYESYLEWSFNELIYSYTLDHLDEVEANNRKTIAANEILGGFDNLLNSFLIPKILPIKQQLEAQNLKIRHIGGRFFPEINRLIFELTLGQNYVPVTYLPTSGYSPQFNGRDYSMGLYL